MDGTLVPFVDDDVEVPPQKKKSFSWHLQQERKGSKEREAEEKGEENKAREKTHRKNSGPSTS